MFQTEATLEITRYVVFTLFLAVTAISASAQTRTWSGPATGDWFTAGNWTPSDNYPQDGESVTIPTNKTILLTHSTANLASFSITNSTLTFTNWTTALVATNVTIYNNGKLSLPAAFTDTDMSNRVWVVCSNFTMHVGGQILADAKGFTDKNGPGTTASTGGGISGAGHGGVGGVGAVKAAAGIIYDDANAPLLPGSGAPPYGNSASYIGHHGGGAVFIDASGTVTLDGTISANAGNLNAPNPSNFAGGGSGGSIYILCHAFGGSTNGILQANGGKGGNVGGAGGGGMIAVDYQTLVGTPGVRCSANRGQGAMYTLDINANVEDFYTAQIGTLWFPNPDFLDAARTAWAEKGLTGFAGYVMFGSTTA